MPGLIDCHAHVVASEVNLDKNALLPNSLVAALRGAHHARHADARVPRSAISVAPISACSSRR